MSKEYVIYKVTNKINGKCYVGATRQGVAVRKAAHISDAVSGRGFCKVFAAALRKYGPDNFDWEVIATVNSVEELFDKEIELIASIKPEYNITKGGQGLLGVAFSAETRAKIAKSHTGMKHTPKTLNLLSEIKNANNPAKVDGELTQSRLQEIFYYSPETGIFTRLLAANQCKGQRAGNLDLSRNGVMIELNGKEYSGHILAWFYVYGVWSMVKHKNGDKSDNRLCNLVAVDRSIVGAGRKRYKSNTSGFKGVSKSGKKYEARICINKVSICLGRFDTPEEASAAYKARAFEHYGNFAQF